MIGFSGMFLSGGASSAILALAAVEVVRSCDRLNTDQKRSVIMAHNIPRPMRFPKNIRESLSMVGGLRGGMKTSCLRRFSLLSVALVH